jgi:hypothetical protein
MKRAILFLALLLACDRRGPSSGQWTLGPPDAGAPVGASDRGDEGKAGVPPSIPADASAVAPDAQAAGPTAGFSGPDAAYDSTRRNEPPLEAVHDAGSDGPGDARACPESGPCD